MTMGIAEADYTQILTDLGVSVTFRQSNSSLDEFGGSNYSFAADVTKTWVFFKRGSKTNLAKFGIIEEGDAYIVVPTTETVNYRDRIIFGGEVFEYTPQCMWAYRYADNVALYKYYTLKKLGTE